MIWGGKTIRSLVVNLGKNRSNQQRKQDAGSLMPITGKSGVQEKTLTPKIL